MIPTQRFCCEFWKNFKNTFFHRTSAATISQGYLVNYILYVPIQLDTLHLTKLLEFELIYCSVQEKNITYTKAGVEIFLCKKRK